MKENTEDKPKMKNEDRPAYPTNGRMHSEMTGITKREFFIAHAPKVVPKWFTPTMPERPVLATPLYMIFGRNSGHKHANIFMEHWNEEEGNFPESEEIPEYFRFEVLKQLDNIKETWKRVHQWDADLNIQTAIQWPIFWADNMLKKLHVEH